MAASAEALGIGMHFGLDSMDRRIIAGRAEHSDMPHIGQGRILQ
jgi:hypothetical protein